MSTEQDAVYRWRLEDKSLAKLLTNRGQNKALRRALDLERQLHSVTHQRILDLEDQVAHLHDMLQIKEQLIGSQARRLELQEREGITPNVVRLREVN